jgi:hypothetical protein
METLRDIICGARVTELPICPTALRRSFPIKRVAAALCYDYNKVLKHFKTTPLTRDNIMALYIELEQSKRNLISRVEYSMRKKKSTALNKASKGNTPQKKTCPMCKQSSHINLNASALRFGIATDGCCVCWETNEASTDMRPAILSCGHLICEPCFNDLRK